MLRKKTVTIVDGAASARCFFIPLKAAAALRGHSRRKQW
jgi:hypothetical protein